MESETLEKFPLNVFGFIKPKHVIISTPNVEFNVLFKNTKKFRHWDHKFEWTRNQFKAWGDKICSKFGYEVYYTGVGTPPNNKLKVGFCSQFAVFTRLVNSKPVVSESHLNYTLIKEIDYPHIKFENLLAQIVSAANSIANQNSEFFINKQTEFIRKQNIRSRTFGKSLMFAYPHKCMFKFIDTYSSSDQFEDAHNSSLDQNADSYNQYGHIKENVLVFPEKRESEHALYPFNKAKETSGKAEQFNDSNKDNTMVFTDTLQTYPINFPHLSFFEVSVCNNEIVTICLSRIEIIKETIDQTFNYLLVDGDYLYITLAYLNHLKEKYHYPYPKDFNNAHLR